MAVVIQVLAWTFLLASFISARTDISEHEQTVIDIPGISSAVATCGYPAAPTTAPTTWVFRRQMDMSMSNSMSPETMTMIEGTQTVVEVVTMGSAGDMETTTLSTVIPTMGMPAISSGNHHNIGAIVGGAIGGVAAVALVVAAFLFWRRRGETELDSTGEVVAVVQSESKPSLDSMRPHNADTVPTPFGRDWQAIYHATHFGQELSTNSNQQLPLSSKQEAARQQRQKELELQMRRLQDEMTSLGPGPGRGLSAVLDPDRAEDARQIEMMKQQIALLQAQQQSSWAQGLTDEPPPGYTADTVNRVVIPDR